MHRIVLAPDSFKECLTAQEVCTALQAGIRDVQPNVNVVCKPMADGGEGTAAILREALNSRAIPLRVQGPLGGAIDTDCELSRDGATAVVETAKANGLDLVPTDKRNPMETSTFGCGQLVAHAIDQKVSRLLLTIGGSSTVDGGTALARALGYRFLDAAGNEVAEGGNGLLELTTIVPPAHTPWEDVDVQVVCDVTNPLLGDRGAARIFGPQKGATPEMVELLEHGLSNLADVIERDLGIDVRKAQGAGAAGGMGAGLLAFLNAKLMPGSELVMDLIGINDTLTGADLVITGEGRTDAQTTDGKVCAGIAGRAKAHGVPCIIVSGSIDDDLTALHELGMTAAFSLSNGPETLEQAMAAAGNRLRNKARDLMRMIDAFRS